MNYANIPAELKQRAQWVVAHEDKIPRNPVTREHADVTNPETWGTFAHAVAAGLRHIGFVLSKDDPYTIIDLDRPKDATQAARHESILGACETYAEVSQSGEGVHVICRGVIPKGVRRDSVEIYSDSRYMICTGNVLTPLPIRDQQELLDLLFREMNGAANAVALTEVPEREDDAVILDRAERAANGAKFRTLWQGDHAAYPSQSEADMALMSILAFYSESNEQCRRLFRESGLGQRAKARTDKYLDYMLGKIRARTEPPRVDFTRLLAKARPTPTPPPKPAVPAKARAALTFPAGLVGRIAEYAMSSAVRPVPEIALATGIGLVAGIAGRAFNISGVGLNQYLILLAKTGTGKEGMAHCIETLAGAVRTSVPMADRFLGPSVFASGQGLMRVLEQAPCFVSVLGEIGLTLKAISSPRANTADLMLKRVLLDLYNKSGFNSVLRPSAYSDRDKNTKLVQSPCVTILGESTPDSFYDGLDLGHVADGLIPRFMVVEYTGGRPALNPRAMHEPDGELVQALAALAVKALAAEQNKTCQTVETEPDALALLNAFETEATKSINDGGEIDAQLWNRAHLKALRLAALLAVGVDLEQPRITTEVADWAIAFVRREIGGVLARFRRGDVGLGVDKQEALVETYIARYLAKPPAERAKGYAVDADLAELDLVPYDYLRRRCRNVAAFSSDRRGTVGALNAVLESLELSGRLEAVTARDLPGDHSRRARFYRVTGGTPFLGTDEKE